jgi:glutaredoxin 2
VLLAADQLSLEIDVRNIWEHPAYERELVEATGKRVVPVLAIGEPEGDRTWMPESRDIIRFLKSKSVSA